MPMWLPKTWWEGQDAYIIGGGDSLKDFDWQLLKGKCTIGCNSAFTLGADICKVNIFGDVKWFDVYKEELSKYKGVLFTNSPQLVHTKIPWLWTMERQARGLHTNALGWNGNTGASAINLAILLGARRIYLLGFDMKLGINDKPNWHDRQIEKPNPEVYDKFKDCFNRVVLDWKNKFPEVEIFNVCKDSDLDCFPKIDSDVFWKESVSK